MYHVSLLSGCWDRWSMIISETQILIQISSSWATNFFPPWQSSILVGICQYYGHGDILSRQIPTMIIIMIIGWFFHSYHQSQIKLSVFQNVNSNCVHKGCVISLVVFVWFFSIVHFQMCPQMTCLNRYIVALVAFVGLFSRVGF